MPYIEQIHRERFKRIIAETEETEIRSPGDLNYLITKLLHEYVRQRGQSYQTYNDCIGALEGAKLELYRCKTAPYEDLKIEQNGDV